MGRCLGAPKHVVSGRYLLVGAGSRPELRGNVTDVGIFDHHVHPWTMAIDSFRGDS